jgi:hypothetical protein
MYEQYKKRNILLFKLYLIRRLSDFFWHCFRQFCEKCQKNIVSEYFLQSKTAEFSSVRKNGLSGKVEYPAPKLQYVFSKCDEETRKAALYLLNCTWSDNTSETSF